jgi:hypothetical protein
MRKDNPLVAGLLRQERLIPRQLTETERKEIRNMLELQWKRVHRAKVAAIDSWILVVADYVVAGVINAAHPAVKLLNAAGAVVITMIPVFMTIAIILTISYFVRYRGASMTEIRIRLAEIESRLGTAETKT